MKALKFSLIASSILTSISVQAAVYQVEDLGPLDNTKRSVAIGINEQNVLLGSAFDKYGFPVDVANMNEDTLESAISAAKNVDPDRWEDLSFDDIKAGNIKAIDREYLKNFLTGRSTDSRSQKVGDRYIFTINGNTFNEVSIFDQDLQDVAGRTRSVVDQPGAINDNNVMALNGTAPFYKVNFLPDETDANPEPTEITYWQRDFFSRAVIQNGTDRVELLPPHATYGGASAAFDVSNSGYVVGYASTAFSSRAETAFEAACIDIEAKSRPETVCVWEVNNANPLYQLRAFRWKIGADNSIEEAKNLGMLYEPAENDTLQYTSSATGVNEAGIAVGYSPMKREEDDTFASIYPVIYQDDQIIDFVDHGEWRSGFAFDINESNIVVGEASKSINGTIRSKFFYYDMDAETIKFPQDFFIGSSSTARAINNNGQIVGEGEHESDLRTRRVHGFLYNISDDKFEDLNDLTVCDSPYTIIDARDINDNGVIAATASVTIDDRDADGELRKDADGNPIRTDVARAVRLIPIANGTKDDCSQVIDIPERKGGQMTWFILASLLTFGVVRRFKRFN